MQHNMINGASTTRTNEWPRGLIKGRDAFARRSVPGRSPKAVTVGAERASCTATATAKLPGEWLARVRVSKCDDSTVPLK